MVAVGLAAQHGILSNGGRGPFLLAVGMREWCQTELATEKSWAPVDLVLSEEIPGRGLVAVLIVEGNKVEVAIGNDKLMYDMDAQYGSESVSIHAKDDLMVWQRDGRSVILPSARLVPKSSFSLLPLPIVSEHYPCWVCLASTIRHGSKLCHRASTSQY